ncbi:hypothetical protein SteCoe_18087 [Stentor coeruleus]|uniref:G-protein coupled receptors family 1 profile domain-containing protein n=1 Tax=Stentor coeruleus TaxID=5963 RepID=A0A1R2BXD5_9CILI|nr:hypothetical protein SteCoe_18087 [Stentor coeruleus]
MLSVITIFILIGSCLSSLSAAIVIFQLLMIKYKDLANFMIFFLMVTDLMIGILTPPILYPISLSWCIGFISLGTSFRQWHKFLVFLIAYCMYSIIVKEKTISLKNIIIYLICTYSLSFIYGVLMAIFFTKILGDLCLMLTDSSEIFFYSLFVWEYLPDFTILIFLFIYYWKIKKVLVKEAEECNLKSVRKRFYMKKLFGYCFVFICYMFPFFNALIIAFSGQVKNWETYREILLIAYSWFPLLDSIAYGFTKSFKRNLINIIWKSPDFDTTEETLKILREEGLIRPRFYLDMIGESEINSFI